MSGGLIYCDSKTHFAWMLKSRSHKFVEDKIRFLVGKHPGLLNIDTR